MKKVLAAYEKSSQGQEVTVFLLSSNREAYIGLAIESVLKQTYSNFQLVILDNFSTDKTEEIVKGFHDNRIHFIQRHSPNEYPNYRFAFEICITEYIVVLHDDDIVEDTYLETVLRTIKNSDFVSVSVSAAVINENGEFTGRQIKPQSDAIFNGQNYFINYLAPLPLSVVFPSAIYKKNFYGNLENFFVYEAGPARDQVIWFQTERLGGSFCILDEMLIRYRVHSNQDSAINSGYMDLQMIDVLLNDSYYEEILKIHQKNVRQRVWRIYRLLSRKYHMGLISKEKFAVFFDYKCVGFIKNTLSGKFFYMMMLFIHHCPFTGAAIKMHLKIKSNFKRKKINE